MTAARLRLKRPTGWFAAGQEVAAALRVLSGDAFKLYVYLCLNAERKTGRITGVSGQAAGLFPEPGHSQAAWEELFQQQICVRREAAVEICDRFWPYEKTIASQPEQNLVSYVEEVRRMIGQRACARISFSVADEQLSRSLHERGVTLVQIEQAIWLGCARKYAALLNGRAPMLITSFHYFALIVEEVARTVVGDSYWGHVRHKAEQLERRWIDSPESRTQKPDEMMETK